MNGYRLMTAMAVMILIVISGCNAADDGLQWMGAAIEGSGTKATDVRTFHDLHGVHLATIGELRVELGDENKLVIEADDNLIKYFITSVEDGILHIELEDGVSIRSNANVSYHLTAKTIDVVRASSSGDIIAEELSEPEVEIALSSSGDVHVRSLKAGRVHVSASSSGDLTIRRLTADRLLASLSSSGDIVIRGGRAEEQEVVCSSSGDYNAEELESDRATVRTSSSGDIRVMVRNSLRAATSSSGSVYYRGDPSVEAQETSSGDVVRIH